MTEHAPPVWRDLTVLAAKQRLYADDGFFREGWADLHHLLQARPIEPLLHRTALVLYKPEAIGSRRVALADRLLGERGFRAVAATPVAFSGATIHGLWRYQLRRNTLDKIRLYTRWAAQAPALLVAYRDEAPQAGLPAGVRLKSLKGPAAVERRQPQDLRSRLGSPNSILNFLHSADEPADIPRELAVLLSAEARDAFVRTLLAGEAEAGSAQLAEHMRRANRRVRAHDVAPDASARRLLRFIRINAQQDTLAADRAAAAIDRCLTGSAGLDLRAFEDALARLGAPDPLDVFAFGTQFIDRDVQGQVGELDEDCVPVWRARLAEAQEKVAAHA